jgi:TetR/AcrR family tetracycline transcriptional repressor
VLVLPDDLELSAAVRSYAMAMRSEYLKHRDGARTFSGTRLTDPNVLRSQERSLASWTRQGFALRQVVDCFEIITSFVVGFVIEEQERVQSTTERYDLDRRDAAVGDDHPLTVAAGRLIFSSADERFARHLDVIIPALTSREELAVG